MSDAKLCKVPMSPTARLEKDEKGIKVDISKYRCMIGSLLYLTASQPDITLSVCICARFQANPRESHLIAVKHILRYLVGTPTLGLWYPKDSSFELYGYSDADYAGSKVDRKSTSGTSFFLGKSLVSWFSKKQNSVALSTAEAEYIAVGSCVAQLLWMKQELEHYGLKYDHIPVYCATTSAIDLSQNPIQHSRSKHIEVRHHFIRDHSRKGDIELIFVSSEEELADIFTKPLIEATFTRIRARAPISSW